jgi:hypothetical protein
MDILATKTKTVVRRQPFFIIFCCLFNVAVFDILRRLWVERMWFMFGDSNYSFSLHKNDITFDIPLSHHQHNTNRPLSEPLSVITLSYNPHVEGGREKLLRRKRNSAEHVMLHNCLLIQTYNNISRNDASISSSSPSPAFNYVVYTDNLSLEVCQHCECQEFKLYNCSCPVDDCEGKRNACEKNHLFSDLLEQEGEFIFLDFDLAMLYPTVLEEVKVRSRTTDFLATRAQASFRRSPRYRNDFNSGLVYIRKIPEADPMLLRRYMYADVANGNQDQAILSYFVHHHYKRWDELSIKWHCRFVQNQSRAWQDPKQEKNGRTSVEVYPDMDIHDCQTLHPPTDEMLEQLKYTLLAP